MICSASLSFLAFTGVLARPDTIPTAFEAHVRAEVASLWSVDSADVRVEWPAASRPESYSGSTPFRVVGRGDDGWLVLVVTPPTLSPRAMRVHVGVLRSVPVAARALRANQTIGALDVVVRREVIWSGTATDITAAIGGWEVRRDLPAGAVLVGNAIAPPKVIAAGEKVVFVWSNHGVQIEREAVAMASARLGEMVQGQAGATRLTGRVTGPGTAQLKENMP